MFLRGIKGSSGSVDSFKFVLEKLVDFNDLDTDLILNAVEHSLKLQKPDKDEDDDSDDKPRFSARNEKKKK